MTRWHALGVACWAAFAAIAIGLILGSAWIAYPGVVFYGVAIGVCALWGILQAVDCFILGAQVKRRERRARRFPTQ